MSCLRTLFLGMTGYLVPITVDVQNVKSPRELMQALTGDPRWTDECNIFSGFYTSLIAPKTDPAVFATLYALAQLPSSKITRENFDPEDCYSGRTLISCVQEDLGSVHLVSWLTPLKERYADNADALKTYTGCEL